MSTPIITVHVLAYPYPSSGHIIPLIDLTRQLLTRGLTVTFVVTPTNLPLLQPLLSSHPQTSLQPLVLSIPETTTSTSHRLLSIIRATREHHFPALLDWFRSHPSPPVAIISDFFLGWTHHFAGEIGIKRLVFSPSGAISHCVSFSLWQDLPKIDNPDDVNSPISFQKVPNCPVYPWWQLNSVYRSGKEGDPDWELYRSINQANKASWGAVLNSFADLESVNLGHLKKEMGHDRVWAVGPLLPSSDNDDDGLGPFDRGGPCSLPSHQVMKWLDARDFRSVVFVCFGSRTFLTTSQMDVLTTALEHSRVHFILSLRPPNRKQEGDDHGEIPEGFEDRTADRGMVIKGWAPQVAILRHRAVGAFLTHCGWNSLMEGVAAGVVMLTWPMGADQFTNAKLLVDQLGVGLRAGEESKIIPGPIELSRLLVESLDENRPEWDRARELSDKALGAVKGGSSDKDLDDLVKRLSEL